MDKLIICTIILYFSKELNANSFEEGFNNIKIVPHAFTQGEYGYTSPLPDECLELLNNFAQHASDFTMCSIKYARPVRVCEQCVDQYLMFTKTYNNLRTTVINDTSCGSLFISQDRLNVVLEYYQNILSVWTKGNCNACYDWSGPTPVLSNNTKHFNNMFNETQFCINHTSDLNSATNNNDEVCQRCLQSYVQLDTFYNSLSKDSIGLDSVCFDIIDSMNSTRSKWSKDLNCCKLLKSPEVIFLCCTGIIAFLPILFYVAVRFCGPLRDLPSVLRESRFKQSFLRSSYGRIN